MKKLSVILIMFICANISFAQINSADCQNKMDFLNDNVDLFAFSFVGKVSEIKILEKFPTSEPPSERTTTIKFDDTGIITETFLTNDRIKVFGRTVYSYDDQNRIIKKTLYNPDGSAVSEYVFGYNSSGNLEYRATQNAVTKKVKSKTEYKYESAKSYSQYSDGKFVRRIRLTKDKKCRIIETNMYKEEDKLENRSTTSFDDKDNITEQIVYSPSGSVIEKTKYEYEYDDKGNWIKQNIYEWTFRDGNAPYQLTITKQRTITYRNSK